jgi:hypothetical protein
MAKSNGIKDLKQAAKLLNKHAPKGESLAYINPEEANILKARGSSGILTVAGVPSYFLDKIWKGIKDVGSSFLGRYTGDKGAGNVIKDAFSVWVGLKAKKDQEGLNAHEMEQFNKLNQMHDFAETQFALNVGEGPKVENVPTTIEDVASYTDVTLPAMKTTAVAEGGRIGYSDGGIYEKALMDAWRTYQDQGGTLSLEKFADLWMREMMKGNAQGGRIGYDAGGNYEAKIKELMDKGLSRELAEIIVMSESSSDRYDLKKAQGGRIGYNLGGIGAMDPRIGYANGMGPHWDVPTFSEGVEQMYESTPSGVNQITDEEFYQTIKPMGTLEQDISGKPQLNRDDLVSQKVMEMLKQLIAMRDRGMIDDTLTDEDLLNTAWSNVKGNYLMEGIQEYKPENLSPSPTEEMLMVGLKPNIQIQSDSTVNTGNPYGSNIWEGWKAAQGGRIGAKEGGIMPLLDLGGMEKDYRQDGGFVPIGRREKADDVPARLSKNEFVFTADAVRNAGGGDIDKGAQRMYNVMKNLEAGGEISEQSQGQV